jgi:hypothetical protein
VRHQGTTIAILGADRLVENILVALLEDAGYATKTLEAYPTSLGRSAYRTLPEDRLH